MTPTELYEWAKAQRLEDAQIRIDRDQPFAQAYPELTDVSKDTYTVVICIRRQTVKPRSNENKNHLSRQLRR